MPTKKPGGERRRHVQKQTGYDFKGIDVLNVSVGTAKFIDLKNQRNNREQTIGIENLVHQKCEISSRPGGSGRAGGAAQRGFFQLVGWAGKFGPGVLKAGP